MLTVLNILIVAYLLLMAYLWGAQGLFSAFLHLVLTIVAGALALAFWEPLAYWMAGFTGSFAPAHAFGVSLIGLFIIILGVLRLALDKLVKGNVRFHPLVNVVAGGACGLCAGVLTAGLVLIGVSFLPLENDIMGYQPLRVEGASVQGQVGDGLWVPVDRQACSFFTMLSGGVFYTDQALALTQPDMALQAHTLRLSRHYDPNSSLAAVPASLSVTGLHQHPLPLKGIPGAIVESLGLPSAATQPAGEPSAGADAAPAGGSDARQLVIVDTKWAQSPGTADDDAVIRLPPTQVRLVAWNEQGRWPEAGVYAPIGAVKISAGGKKREFIPLTGLHYPAADPQQDAWIGWVFNLEAGKKPQFILLRNFRLSLVGVPLSTTQPDRTEPESDAEFVKALGQYVPPPVKKPEPGPSTGGGPGPTPLKLQALEVNDALPMTISKNIGRRLEYRGTAVESGEDDVAPPDATVQLAPETRADRVYAPEGQVIVRARIDPVKAQELLGRILSMAKTLQPFYLRDAEGQNYLPSGYAWLQQPSRVVSIKMGKLIQAAAELPLRDVKKDDTLFLYFRVPKGCKITAFQFGPETTTVDVAVPQ